MLSGFHEVLDDDWAISQRRQHFHDPVNAQVACQPNGSWRQSFDDRITLRQVVAMPVLVRIVDQLDIPPGESVVEEAILGRRHHPAPVHGCDRLRLLRDPSNDKRRVVAPDQGVVIDKDISEPKALNCGDLGLERPIRAGWFERVSAEDEIAWRWPVNDPRFGGMPRRPETPGRLSPQGNRIRHSQYAATIVIRRNPDPTAPSK